VGVSEEYLDTSATPLGIKREWYVCIFLYNNIEVGQNDSQLYKVNFRRNPKNITTSSGVQVIQTCTTRHVIHLQFDTSANALEIRAIQSPKCVI
jgi:hypothetical protein